MVVIGVALGIGARALFVSSQMMSSSSLPSGGFGEVAIGGPFALVDHNDKPRTDGEFRGRLMLVAFGYTFCPDVCPLDLQLMGDALAILGPDGDKVQPIFISVDPARDTPAVL
ncbi:MAG: SCO family protein, partial [Rhodospirillales bacterium]|nr:SCO family protein [Rhodospirillales bacterium]